jgi:hypothetical protein
MKTQSRSSGHATSGLQPQWPISISTTLFTVSAAGRGHTQTGTTAFRIPVPTPLMRRDMHIHGTFMALHWRAAPTIPHTEPNATPQIRPYLSPAQPPSKQPSRAPTIKVSPGPLVLDGSLTEIVDGHDSAFQQPVCYLRLVILVDITVAHELHVIYNTSAISS